MRALVLCAGVVVVLLVLGVPHPVSGEVTLAAAGQVTRVVAGAMRLLVANYGCSLRCNHLWCKSTRETSTGVP